MMREGIEGIDKKFFERWRIIWIWLSEIRFGWMNLKLVMKDLIYGNNNVFIFS